MTRVVPTFVLIILLALTVSARAAVIYRETFGIPATATVDESPLVFGWARFDDFGREIIGVEPAAGVNHTVNGFPADLANVNAGPNSDGTMGPYARGLLYMEATPSPSLALTTEYAVNVADYLPGSVIFSWYEGNNTVPHFLRAVVRVGAVWYASVETFGTPATAVGNFGTQAQLKTLKYDPTAAKWLRLTFNGDVSVTEGQAFPSDSTLGAMTLAGPPAANLSGSITGFGVYGENGGSGTGNRRIDTFTIEAEPIPLGALSLTVVGSATGGWSLRGTGGEPNRQFRLLATSDPATTIANWSVVVTQNLDANGEFSLGLPASVGPARQFYVAVVP